MIPGPTAIKIMIPESKIFGGKTYLCKRIAAYLGDYNQYYDGFGGMGSMTYNVPRCEKQVFNDLDYDKCNLKMAVKLRCKELQRELRKRGYNQSTFDWSKNYDYSGRTFYFEDFDRAVAYLCRTRMSRGGLGKDYSWTPISSRTRGGQQAETNAWQQMLIRLPTLSARLQDVDIRNENVFVELRRMAEGWTYYLDPPYCPDVRTGGTEYGAYEMSYLEHLELVDIVKRHPSRIVISHYPFAMYDSLGWRRVDFDMPNHSGQGDVKERRTESLYLNF